MARGEDAILAIQQELAFLKEQLEARNREIFGASSERRPRGASGEAKGAAERTGHGRREQPELPMVDVVHVLDEADTACPKCGGELAPWDGHFEEAEEIDVVERSFRIVRHRRQKYTCRCGECIETALGPRKLIAGGRYSVEFAVAAAVAKYADHLPLARQVKQMARAGLVVDTQTLWDQLHALSAHLEPTYEALWGEVLGSEVVLADETQWPLLDKPGSTKCFAWSAASEKGVAYRILKSRSAEAARRVLDGFTGILVTDGYAAYQAMRDTLGRERAGPVVLAHCWAHVRRKFHDAEPAWRRLPARTRRRRRRVPGDRARGARGPRRTAAHRRGPRAARPRREARGRTIASGTRGAARRTRVGLHAARCGARARRAAPPGPVRRCARGRGRAPRSTRRRVPRGRSRSLRSASRPRTWRPSPCFRPSCTARAGPVRGARRAAATARSSREPPRCRRHAPRSREARERARGRVRPVRRARARRQEGIGGVRGARDHPCHRRAIG